MQRTKKLTETKTYKIHLTRAEDVRRLLSVVINELRRNEIPVDRARAINACCNTLLKILEAGDFEKRLERLEEYCESKNTH